MEQNIPNVEDIMVKDVICARLPGTRDEVLHLLREKNVSGVPVTKGDKLVGIVSRTNILKNPEEEHLALLMSKDPVTIKVGQSLVEAAQLLYGRKIRRLPVIDDSGKLVGLITTADVIGYIARMNMTDQIKDYIKPHVYTLWEDAPVDVIMYQMNLADVKACPVIDSDMNLVGIISDRDIVRSSVIEDRVEKSDMSAADDEDAWRWESMRDTLNLYYSVSKVSLPIGKKAKDLMIRDPITATRITTISDCALKMRRNKIDQIPIVDFSGKLSGIIRDQELLKPLIDKYA
ncbi:MAG: CBS domain-containing protein [Methanosarcinaceae archaeon]|nr:CBS domain-containing protein [Methanosarcinaceae archaeon]